MRASGLDPDQVSIQLGLVDLFLLGNLILLYTQSLADIVGVCFDYPNPTSA